MARVQALPGNGDARQEAGAHALLLQATVGSGIAAAAGLAATCGRLPAPAWGAAAVAAAALVSLGVSRPLRALRRLSPLPTLAVTAVAVLAGLAAASGGLASPALPADVAAFAIAATLCPPPLPLWLGLADLALLAAPWPRPGVAPPEVWRLAVGLLGALAALVWYGPVARSGLAARQQQEGRVRAVAAIARAFATLDLEQILPLIAAELGRLTGACRALVLVRAAPGTGTYGGPADNPEPGELQAAWSDREDPEPATPADLGEPCRRAAEEAAPLARGPDGAWRPVADGPLPPGTSAVAVPLGREDAVLGAVAVAAAPGRRLPRWALDALRELAEYAALGVQAAQLHEDSRRQAMLDPITHLYNARYLRIRLEEELARARRRREPLSLLFLDSDSLKTVNDRYGHPHGDRLVRALAQMIRQHVRAEDIPVRYAGGDEFVVILPNTDWPEAAAIAERLCRQARKLPVGPRGEPIGTVSVGVATYPTHARSAAELVERADQAMYVAKAAGKDCVAVYGEGVQLVPGGPEEGAAPAIDPPRAEHGG
jgi:diguanylate cyclase (GGDEF)-like protein